MKILSIQPKDIYVTIEFGLHEVKSILDFLNNSTIEYDGEKQPLIKEAAEYVTNTLYPELERMYKDLAGEVNSGT